MLDKIVIIQARINLMKILSFFSRATIILFLQICFVTSLTISFCEPVFAAQSSKKKKSKKKKKKKSKKQKKKEKKKKAEKKVAEKRDEEEKHAPKPEKKPEPKPTPQAVLTKFQTQTTYWCGSVYCDRAKDDDDAACLLRPNNKPMQCIYGDINSNPRDKSLEKLKRNPEDDTGMEMCLYELRAICGGYSTSFNAEKVMVSAECEKGEDLYMCLPAYENVPKAPMSTAALGSTGTPPS